MKSFTLRALTFSILAVSALNLWTSRNTNRAPASAERGFELTFQTLSLNTESKIHSLKNVYIRATIGDSLPVEFGQGENWSLEVGDNRKLDIRLPVQEQHIQNDALKFKVELITKGKYFETTLVRCATVSKTISSYNRSFHCTLPGESTPILTYRLEKIGSKGYTGSIAAHN